MRQIDFLCFQVLPYVAVAVCVVGCLARFRHAGYTWRTGSTQLLSDRWLRLGSNCFHVGVLAILAGHFVGLLTPEWAYKPLMTSGQKQLLAMVAGGFFGAVCLFGLVLLIGRRLFDPRIRATGSARDMALLWLLLAQLLLGLASIAVSAGHLDGAQMVKLAEWAQRIVTFRGGAAERVADAHWIFKAHITLGLLLVMLVPFTRLVHVLSLPLGYLTRPYQVVRRRSAPLDYAGR